ncbi:histone deacetylase domain-containing protein [Apiospora kogelbergensis]|uniref:Histone deacetylase domain-containing protein n=1 Tax=Apiospora kogelbergensis TaxID=1337665 RepID=A0AAW0QP64_9PEZI
MATTPNHRSPAALDIAAANKPPRRSDVDAALAQSMQSFSLNSPGPPHAHAKPSPRQNGPLPYPNHPPLPTSDRASLGVSPTDSRNASRSPISRSVSTSGTPQSRSGTPTLLRKTSSTSLRSGTPTLLKKSSNTSLRSGTPALLRKSSTSSLRSTNGITPSRAPSRAASRRDSSTSLASPNPRSPMNFGPQPVAEEPRKPRVTESFIANTYFKSELDMLHNSESAKPSDTLVILHDSCYGHRFSRPKTTKGNLATIVERPERLQACALGVALAYVRLGERHCDGKIPIHSDLDPATLANIPFRIRKTDRTISLTSPIVTNVHGSKWMEELSLLCDAAEAHLAAGNSELKRPNMDRGPGVESPKPFHEGDLYLCKESLAAFEGALGAVCEAVDAVMTSQAKRAFVGVRPPVITARLTTLKPKNAAFWKKSSIGYFSLHDINSYPCEAGDIDNIKNASLCIDNAHGQNVWNVHLQEWSSEVEFWRLYQSKYSVLLEKTRNYLRRETERLRAAGQEPKAAIFISAGFDASEWEGAGMQRHTVNVPTEFYARITRDVVKLAAEEGLSVEGRVISALEGGYSDRALCSGVLSHISGLAGSDAKNAKEESPSRMGRDISRRISVFNNSPLSSSPLSRRSTLSSDIDARPEIPGFPYDPSWWSQQELDQLDAAKVPLQPLPDPRIPRQGPLPTYCSPTQSSVAKARDPDRVRRSASGYMGTQPIAPREPTPPPPEVHWPVAALELSKLLIPTDRPVNSITWEELKADSNRIKRDRQSLPAQGTVVESTENNGGVRKSLRERKPVKPISPTEFEEPTTNRRRTASARGIPSHGHSKSRQSNRRLSTASTVLTASDDSLESANVMGPPPYPRPDTSQSIRPESSMSVRTNVTLDVKKTRPTVSRAQSARDAPNGANKAATAVKPPARPKSRASKKKTGLDSGEPSPALPPDPFAAQVAPSQSQAPAQAPSVSPSRAGPDSDDEVSKLTSGVKKITLVTKEMREAREAAKKAQSSGQTTPTTTKPAVKARGSASKAKADTTPVSKPQPKTDDAEMQDPLIAHPSPTEPRRPTPSEIKTDRHISTMGRSDSPDPLTSTLPSPRKEQTQDPQTQYASSNGVRDSIELDSASRAEGLPTTPTIEIHQPTASELKDQATDLFVPYQPEGSTPRALPQTAPLKWLPPNQAETPKVTKKGHQFTAKSAIPFADSPKKEKPSAPFGQHLLNKTPAKIEKQEDDVREIPETPDCR